MKETMYNIMEKLEIIERKLDPDYRGSDGDLNDLRQEVTRLGYSVEGIKDDQRRIWLSLMKPSLIGLEAQEAERKIEREWPATTSGLKTLLMPPGSGIRGTDLSRVKIYYNDTGIVDDVVIG
jgi:hypothetical protein